MTEATPSENKFKLYSVGELSTFTKPKWLIQHVIERGALGVLYGPTKSGKSFLALDWALSIALNQPWQGREVSAGPVLYVIGEGASGVPKRISAWMKTHGVSDVPNAFFLVDVPQVSNISDLESLVAVLDQKDVQPRLIVFDTLARCFVGKDENSAAEMGRLIEGCRWLQEQTSSTVLLLHHSGKSGDAERGSSALAAGSDVMIALKKDSKRLRVDNTKQKNAAEFGPFFLQLKGVPLAEGSGNSLEDSCVLIPCALPESAVGSALGAVPMKALTSLYDIDAASSGGWRKKLAEYLDKPLAQKTFDNWRKHLVTNGHVQKVDGKYELTPAGEALLKEKNAPNPATQAVA